MSDLALTAIIAPLVLLLAGFILNEILRPLVQTKLRRPSKAADAALVGEPVPIPEMTPWQERAYAGMVRERDDALEDHARYINAHRACHELLQQNGIPIPHDD